MDVSLYQAAAAMNASSRWQEVISDNLAASQIPGFKKQDLSFSAVQAGLMARTPAATQRFSMPLAGTSTNFQPGELRSTGVATDLAIEGPGFFQAQTSDGTLAYTRDGEFRMNTQGQLTTKQGSLVMGDAGPIQLDVNNSTPISVANSGEVAQGKEVKGRIKVLEFSNPGALAATGTGMFVNTDPAAQPTASTTAAIRQSFLESGNTSSMAEMGNLITAMRLFEANQKVIQTEDDRVSRLITDVGNPGT
jgi:flagellar basal body rod protein FlgG